MTCKDCIHSGLCYKENDYENFPDRCGDFISDKVLEERPQGEWEVKQCLDSEGDIAGYDVCCSECGKVLFHLMNRVSSVEEAKEYIKEEDFTNFCPDCGASMRKISKE